MVFIRVKFTISAVSTNNKVNRVILGIFHYCQGDHTNGQSQVTIGKICDDVMEKFAKGITVFLV